MPRFYFHLVDGALIKDPDGTVCPTLADARAHALKVAGDMAKNRPRADRAGRAILVSDETGKELLRVSLRGQRRNA